jgi:hypothetical protein
VTDTESSSNPILTQAHRFELAAGDMRDVAAAAAWLSSASDVPRNVARVVEAGIAVVYARPFTDQGIGTLSRKKYAPLDTQLRGLHDRLIDLRNRLHAHTEASPLRFVAEAMSEVAGIPVSVIGIEPGSAVEVVVETIPPTQLPDVARMAREQSERFVRAEAEAREKLPEPSRSAAPKRLTFSTPTPTVVIGDPDEPEQLA